MKNKLRINAVITTVAVVVCVVLLNLIISVISDKMPLKIDMTRERVYEFSDQTQDTMKNLSAPVEVYALYPDDVSGDYVSYVKEYLSKYETLSPNFKVTYVDPYNDPTFVRKFEENGDTVDVGSVIVTSGDNFRVLSFNDLYSTNQFDNSVSIDMERKMTSAIIAVTGASGQKKAFYTEGHDEYVCSNIIGELENEGYVCESINLAMAELPDDASLLIICDPTMDFSAEEIEAVDNYSDAGGNILVLSQSGKEIPQRFAQYLSDWGIVIENDFVIEGDTDHMFRSQYGGTIPAPEMVQHEITSSLISRKLNFMSPMTRSITTNENNVYKTQFIPLLQTTENSWAKTDLSSTVTDKEDGDREGPLTVAVISQRYAGENESQLLVISSLASMETSGLLSQGNYANGDFLLNCVSFMSGETSSLDIRAKQISDEALTMTQSQVILVTIILLYILPIAIFAVGLIVWWRRRYL